MVTVFKMHILTKIDFFVFQDANIPLSLSEDGVHVVVTDTDDIYRLPDKQ